ncbi:MAG TPA: hypothetical protein VH092_25815 [Urbifossiella sp.]|nr:hypothetical protein [Urbifossiella sp.]
MVPFRLQYTLGRRDRLAVESTPHLPALAAALGFTTGIAYLALVVSGWFVAFLVLLAYPCHGLVTFLVELVLVSARPVDVLVESDRLGFLVGENRVWLGLEGVIQVFRSDNGRTWTLLHLNGSVLTIPGDVILPAQLEFLKGFALRAWRHRQQTEPAL